jgi:hypothetical protein
MVDQDSKKNGLDRLFNRIEAVIATAIVEAALAKGWAITVNDGEEDAIKRGTHRQQVLDAMSSTDDDRLTFFDMGNGGARVGSVWLIYGNDQDVVSDWTMPRAGGDPIGDFLRPIFNRFGL